MKRGIHRVSRSSTVKDDWPFVLAGRLQRSLSRPIWFDPFSDTDQEHDDPWQGRSLSESINHNRVELAAIMFTKCVTSEGLYSDVQRKQCLVYSSIHHARSGGSYVYMYIRRALYL